MRIVNNSYRLALFSGAFHSARMLIGALQAIYLLGAGVSLNNLAVLKGYFALLVLIFDIPFGMMGDFISNKLCLYLSCLFVALYYGFSLYAPNMTFLMFAETFYAMGLCLISGAFESLLIASVKTDYPQHPTKISYFYFLSGEIMAIGSMFLAPIGVLLFLLLGKIGFIYELSGILMLTLPFFIYSIDERALYSERTVHRLNLSYFKSILMESKNLIYISVSSLIVIAYQPIYHFWQPLFIRDSEDTLIFPAFGSQDKNSAVVLGGIFLIYSSLNYLANKLAKLKLSNQISSFNMTLILVSLLLMTALLVVILPSNRIYSLILCFSLLHGLMTIFSNLTKSVLISDSPQYQIATVISSSNVVGRFLSTVILFGCSFLISTESIQYVFLVSFFSVLVASFIYLNHLKERSLVDLME